MNTDFKSRLSKIESFLSNALPSNLSSQWLQSSFADEYPAITSFHAQSLAEPCKRLVDAGGKRWRPLLLVLSALMQIKADYPNISDDEAEEKLNTAYSLTPLLEFVHTASLIHDDIEDGADTRRGLQATHLVYGLDTAINAGSWLYFEAAVCINALNNTDLKLKIYELYTQELRRLHLGQAMDISWHRESEKIPSKDEYFAMVKNKTGTLSSLASQLGILAGGGKSENAKKLGAIAADIGAGFQVMDDVINLTTGNAGKKRGDDIVEGKKSLPALLYLENSDAEGKKELFDCFYKAKEEGINSAAVEKAISLMQSNNSIEKAKKEAQNLIYTACTSLHQLYKDNKGADLIEELFISMIPN